MPRHYGLPPDLSPNDVDAGWPTPIKWLVAVVLVIVLFGIFVA